MKRRFPMRMLVGSLIAVVIVAGISVHYAQSPSNGRQTIATEEDFRRAMKELSNWGRWGKDDELGAANLITPAKRKQAIALAREGLTISLAHDVMQEKTERVKVSAGDVILLYTGRWKRRAALGPWPNTTGFAGYHADVAYFIKERGVSFIADDGPNDVMPTGLPPSITTPLHKLALVAMGVSIFDNLDIERAAEEAKRLNRYEFLFMAAPLRIDKGTGSPLNPLAIF